MSLFLEILEYLTQRSSTDHDGHTLKGRLNSFQLATQQENPGTSYVSRWRRPEIRGKEFRVLNNKGFGVSLEIPLRSLTLKSPVTRIVSEPLSNHLENVTNNTYIIV